MAFSGMVLQPADTACSPQSCLWPCITTPLRGPQLMGTPHEVVCSRRVPHRDQVWRVHPALWGQALPALCTPLPCVVPCGRAPCSARMLCASCAHSQHVLPVQGGAWHVGASCHTWSRPAAMCCSQRALPAPPCPLPSVPCGRVPGYSGGAFVVKKTNSILECQEECHLQIKQSDSATLIGTLFGSGVASPGVLYLILAPTF